jgi:O-antigen ligase
VKVTDLPAGRGSRSLAFATGIEPFMARTILSLWLVYLLFAPTLGFGWINSWHNEQRAIQIILLAATGLAYGFSCRRPQKRDKTSPWSLPTLILVFLGLGVLSALNAKFVFAALAEVSLVALLAILALFTAQAVATDPPKFANWARWFALLFATAYALGVATRYLAALNLERAVDLDVLILGYANPRFPSALHALLIPFIAATASEPRERRWLRLIALIILSTLWAINIGLGTRGIWFAYAIGLPLTALLLDSNSVKRSIVVIAKSCLIGVFLYFVFFKLIPSVVGSASAVSSPMDNLSSVTGRDVLWRTSLEALLSAPLLGIGPMQFASHSSHMGAHPHNWVLQIASEWGLPALFVWVLALVHFGKAVTRSPAKAEIVPPVMAITVCLSLGLVDGNLVMPISQSSAFLVLGLLLGLLQCNDAKASDQVRENSRALIVTGTFCLLAVVIVTSYAYMTLAAQPASVSRFHRTNPGEWLLPRFWEQGLL